MKKYTKYIAVLACTVLVLPMVAKADAIGDLQSQIQVLLNQVKTMQDQIKAIRQASSTSEWHASSTPAVMGGGEHNEQGDSHGFCVSTIARDLGIGSRGDDVKDIQRVLATDPAIYSGTTTGYFGPQTARAMAMFQAKFGIASTSTGFVGPITRQFLQKQCPPPGMMQGLKNGNGQGDDQHENDGGHMMGSTTPMRPMPPVPVSGTMAPHQGGDR